MIKSESSDIDYESQQLGDKIDQKSAKSLRKIRGIVHVGRLDPYWLDSMVLALGWLQPLTIHHD